MLNNFLGKNRLISFCVLLGFFAFAKAQAAQTPDVEEYVITADDDRANLLVMTDLLKSKYGIQTRFKDYKLNNRKLINLGLEFIPSEGESRSLMVKSDNGIETQLIVINVENNQIIFVGAKSEMSPAKDIAFVTAVKKAKSTAGYVKVSDVGEPKQSVEARPKVNESEVNAYKTLKDTEKLKAENSANQTQKEAAAIKTQQQKIETQTAELEKKEVLKRTAEAKLRANKTNAKEDAERKKKSLEELKRLQTKKIKDQAEKAEIEKRYVFINSKAYNYKIVQDRTIVLDESGRTVLVLPAELSKQPFSGTIPLNRLRYQFSLKDNVISLYNGAGEPVDINGKEL